MAKLYCIRICVWLTGGDPGSDEIYDVLRGHRDTSCADFEAEKCRNTYVVYVVAHARDFFFDRKSYVFEPLQRR